MKKKIFTSILIFLFLLQMSFPFIKATQYIDENWEGYIVDEMPPSPWVSSESGGATIRVVNTLSHEGYKSCKLYCPSSGEFAAYTYQDFTPITETETALIWVYVDSYTYSGDTDYAEIGFADDGLSAFLIGFGANNKLKRALAFDWYDIGDYQLDVWMNITIVFNVVSDQYTVYKDSSNLGTFPFRFKRSEVDRFLLGSGYSLGACNLYFDEVQIPPIPPEEETRYYLNIFSSPINTTFYINGTPYSTPFSADYLNETILNVTMPAETGYYGMYEWLHWNDSVNDRSRILTMDENISLIGEFYRPNRMINISSSPINVIFTLNGTNYQTPYSHVYPKVTILNLTMPPLWITYDWEHWNDSYSSRKRLITLISNTSLTGEYIGFTGLTIGNTTSNIATSVSWQNKNFYANWRTWVFTTDGTNGVYKTCYMDTWSNFKIFRTGINRGDEFSIWYDEKTNYLHYTYSDRDILNSSLYYRKGFPRSDGNINWVTPEQIVMPGFILGSPNKINCQYFNPTIATDSNGYPWIGYTHHFFLTYNPPSGSWYYYNYITKSKLNNGYWETDSGFPYLLQTDNFTLYVKPVPMLNGKMYVLYPESAINKYFYGRVWDGDSWETEEIIKVGGIDYSATSMGDKVVIAHKTSYWQEGWVPAIGISYRNYPSAWEFYYLLVPLNKAPIIAASPSNNFTIIFWSQDNHHIYYVLWFTSNKTFGNTVDWKREQGETIIAGLHLLSSSFRDYGGRIGLIYETLNQPDPLYNVKYVYTVTYTAQEPGPPTIIFIGTNSTKAGAYIKFYCLWQANWGEMSHFKFLTNMTGTWIHTPYYPLSGLTAWSNITRLVPNKPGLLIGYRFVANNTYGAWGDSGDRYIILSLPEKPKTTLSPLWQYLPFFLRMLAILGPWGYVAYKIKEIRDLKTGLHAAMIVGLCFVAFFVIWFVAQAVEEMIARILSGS